MYNIFAASCAFAGSRHMFIEIGMTLFRRSTYRQWNFHRRKWGLLTYVNLFRTLCMISLPVRIFPTPIVVVLTITMPMKCKGALIRKQETGLVIHWRHLFTKKCFLSKSSSIRSSVIRYHFISMHFIFRITWWLTSNIGTDIRLQICMFSSNSSIISNLTSLIAFPTAFLSVLHVKARETAFIFH